MSTANLLNINDPAFEFWEAMVHRQLLGAMAPLTRFSVLPYNLDPMPEYPGPAARFWMLNHQRAQTDAISTIPTWGWPGPNYPPYPGSLDVSVPENQNLQDYHIAIPEQAAWFAFVNHQELYVASTFLPEILTFPFW